MDKITVLIADDSPATRDGLQSILRAYPEIKVVGEATNGVEAIASAEELQPGVILMDAQMPELDGCYKWGGSARLKSCNLGHLDGCPDAGVGGIAATRQIKERWPNIKILLLTVHKEYIEAGLAAGADGYLLKDSGRQELLQAIKELGRR